MRNKLKLEARLSGNFVYPLVCTRSADVASSVAKDRHDGTKGARSAVMTVSVRGRKARSEEAQHWDRIAKIKREKTIVPQTTLS